MGDRQRRTYYQRELRVDGDVPSGSPRKGPRGGPDDARYSPSRAGYMESQDLRPRGEYDEPWEWSCNQNLRQQAADNQSKTPLMTPKRTNSEKHSTVAVKTEEATVERAESPPLPPPPPPEDDVPEDDDEGYTHLKEELGTDLPAPPPEATAAALDVRPKESKDPEPPRVKDSTGNYDEPWDLTHTQKELEEKLLAMGKSSKGSPRAAQKPPHESDTRPQEGYEKPWDWKPDKRDDRPQEGYEKPWDWKPDKRDDRPPEEYEEPWDQKKIEIDLIHAKSAKEALKEGATTSATAATNGMVAGPSLGQKSDDMRPGDEYDEPWDQKMKKMALTRTSSDGSNKSSSSPVLPGHSRGGAEAGSPSKICNVAERINPLLPLDEQGWYHGSISRSSAESLLRVHKEGSYLVRLSESNKMDYSLSLKSSRGFMHMKITHRDSQYILGQFSQPFESIPLMIHHYCISKLPIKGQEHMSLLHPIIHELL